MDIYGKACLDYLNGKKDVKIKFDSKIAEMEDIPVHYLFRSYEQMPIVEQVAIQEAKGKILDVGAGTGSHALKLQSLNQQVTALEISPGLCKIIKQRGVEKVIQADIFEYSGTLYDSILFMMNGIGICRDFEGLKKLLNHLKSLMSKTGQILLDSSDLIYLFIQEDGSIELPLNETYYGEMPFRVEYNSDVYEDKWLYIDPDNLEDIAQQCSLKCEIIQHGEHYDYLAKLTL